LGVGKYLCIIAPTTKPTKNIIQLTEAVWDPFFIVIVLIHCSALCLAYIGFIIVLLALIIPFSWAGVWVVPGGGVKFFFISELMK